MLKAGICRCEAVRDVGDSKLRNSSDYQLDLTNRHVIANQQSWRSDLLSEERKSVPDFLAGYLPMRIVPRFIDHWMFW